MPVRSCDLAGTSLCPQSLDCSCALQTHTSPRPESRCVVRTITGLATGNHVADLHLTYPLVSTSAPGPLKVETSMFSGGSIVVTDRLMRTMTDRLHQVKRVFDIPRVIPPNRAKSPDRSQLSTCFTQPCTQPPAPSSAARRHARSHPKWVFGLNRPSKATFSAIHRAELLRS